MKEYKYKQDEKLCRYRQQHYKTMCILRLRYQGKINIENLVIWWHLWSSQMIGFRKLEKKDKKVLLVGIKLVHFLPINTLISCISLCHVPSCCRSPNDEVCFCVHCSRIVHWDSRTYYLPYWTKVHQEEDIHVHHRSIICILRWEWTLCRLRCPAAKNYPKPKSVPVVACTLS